MRGRRRILDSLEKLYSEAYQQAETGEDAPRMAQLDFEFQRDQLWFEVLLDLRDVVQTASEPEADAPSLLEKAQALRNLTKLPGLPKLK